VDSGTVPLVCPDIFLPGPVTIARPTAFEKRPRRLSGTIPGAAIHLGLAEEDLVLATDIGELTSVNVLAAGLWYFAMHNAAQA
jgi:hypothetical protein